MLVFSGKIGYNIGGRRWNYEKVFFLVFFTGDCGIHYLNYIKNKKRIGGFMKTYSYNERPIKVFGVVDFEKKGKIQRLPDELIEKIPRLSKLGRRCAGARLCFKTDSESIKIRITFESLSMDVGMSIYSCQSAAVYAGDRHFRTYPI